VSAVNQAVGERGLRETRYSPNHNATNNARKLTEKVI